MKQLSRCLAVSLAALLGAAEGFQVGAWLEGQLSQGRIAQDHHTLDVHGVLDDEQAARLLDTSPVSCVRFDLQSRIARFSVGPEDLYDPSELWDGNMNASGMRCKTASTAPMAMMVPTYPHHQAYYSRLVASVKQHLVVAGRTTAFITVFSSLQEGGEITRSCSACLSSKSLELRSLIFNYKYLSWKYFAKKVNYQAAKKMWALSHVDHEQILMLDSDFALLHPVALPEVIATYEHVLYEVPVLSMQRDTKFWVDMLGRVNKVLNTSFNVVTFEMPWIYSKTHVTGLIARLEQVWADDWIHHFMNLGQAVFEILLYRFFVLEHQPSFFSRHIPTAKTWFDDGGAVEAERLTLSPPPIGVRHYLQERHPCSICWLDTYADRGEVG